MQKENLGKEYLDTVIRRMLFYKELGEKTLEQLDEADFHYQPNEESNSLAVIIQHMHGNMLSRWTNFLSEDGEKTWRQRDDEFEIHGYTREMIVDLWQKGWDCLLSALKSLEPEDLLKVVHIRKEELSAMDAINRQLAHYPYHIGQMIYIGKLLKNKKWKNLSIPRGDSKIYNQTDQVKDPAKKF